MPTPADPLEPPPRSPVAAGERLTHLDAIRGLALLGVLVMNVHGSFRAPWHRYQLTAHPWPGPLDVATDWLLALLVEGKAMSAFALLFAVGLAIQRERAAARGAPFTPTALRRLGALFIFGALHLLLVWNGDILHTYALMGVLLLPFLRRSLGTILAWLGALWALLLAVLAAGALALSRGPGPPGWDPAALATAHAWLQAELQARASGSWLAAAQFRLREWADLLWPGPEATLAVHAFLQFLLGLALWKSGLLKTPAAHRRALRALAAGCLPLGLLFAFATTLALELQPADWARMKGALPILAVLRALAAPVLSLGFCAALLLLLPKPPWARLLAPFALAGRMAFTNYLLQSLAMTTLFCGWGLGLYDRLGPLAGLLLSLAAFALQLAFSAWWLSRYRFGPLEWLWRCITYWRLQPLRR